MNNSSCWYQGGGGMFDWWVSWQPHIQLEGVSGIDYPDSTPPLYQPIQWQWRFFQKIFSKQTKKDSGPSPGLEGDQVEEGEVGAGEVGDSPVSSLPDTAASTPS